MQVLRGESKGMIKHCVKLNPLRRHHHVHSRPQVKSPARLPHFHCALSLPSPKSSASQYLSAVECCRPEDNDRDKRSMRECGLLLDCRPRLYLLQETITLTCSKGWSFITISLLCVLQFHVVVCSVEWITVLLDSSYLGCFYIYYITLYSSCTSIFHFIYSATFLLRLFYSNSSKLEKLNLMSSHVSFNIIFFLIKEKNL